MKNNIVDLLLDYSLEQKIEMSPEGLRASLKKVIESENKLKEKLNKEQLALLEDFNLIFNDYGSEECDYYFTLGFKTGVKLMIDVFNN
jgi:hypothetical protein